MKRDAFDFFEQMVPAAIEAGRLRMQLPGTVRFDVTGARRGAWLIDASTVPHRCAPVQAPEAEAACRIEIDAEDFASVLRGATTMEELYYRERLQVSGDLGLAVLVPGWVSEVLGPSDLGLGPLVAPMSREDFLGHWPTRRAVIHGSPDRLPAFARLPSLRDVRALLDHWTGMIRVFPPNESDHMSPMVDTKTAWRLYERGFTLVFSAAEQQIPGLLPYLEHLRRDLGLPRSVWARCMIYANPTNGLLNPHFDENANFSIQLSGTKVWRLAVNEQVVHPTVGYVMTVPEPHPELRAQLKAPLVRTMPADAEVVTMRAGSVMFIPRGDWHATSTPEASLSLNFTFDQPTWADVVTTALRSRLLRSESWRELATGIDSADATAHGAAAARLEPLLAGLAAELAGVTPATVGDALRERPLPEIDTIDMSRDWYEVLAPLGHRAGG